MHETKLSIYDHLYWFLQSIHNYLRMVDRDSDKIEYRQTYIGDYIITIQHKDFTPEISNQ